MLAYAAELAIILLRLVKSLAIKVPLPPSGPQSVLWRYRKTI
jgi:hypothetical protein